MLAIQDLDLGGISVYPGHFAVSMLRQSAPMDLSMSGELLSASARLHRTQRSPMGCAGILPDFGGQNKNRRSELESMLPAPALPIQISGHANQHNQSAPERLARPLDDGVERPGNAHQNIDCGQPRVSGA